MCQIKLAGGRAEEALKESANLLNVVFDPRRQVESVFLQEHAESVFLQGEILEKLGRLAEALQTYTNNLADNLPDSMQRQALAKTVQLTMAPKPVGEAIQALTPDRAAAAGART